MPNKLSGRRIRIFPYSVSIHPVFFHWAKVRLTVTLLAPTEEAICSWV